MKVIEQVDNIEQDIDDNKQDIDEPVIINIEDVQEINNNEELFRDITRNILNSYDNILIEFIHVIKEYGEDFFTEYLSDDERRLPEVIELIRRTKEIIAYLHEEREESLHQHQHQQQQQRLALSSE